MINKEIEEILEHHGIRPTSNRIMVLRSLMQADNPVCLADLENNLQTVEKSSVSRVLSLLLEKGVIHNIEDGRGITRYEMCHGPHTHEAFHEHEDGGDMHTHFYCEKCHKVYCLPIPAPRIEVPEGFSVHSVNYMLKGVCPSCR